MQRKASKLVLMSAGAALAWFLDPVSGSDRRRQLSEQLSGLTGKISPPSDPTGGAAPPTMGATPPPRPAQAPDDPTLLHAVDAAGADENVLRVPGDGDDEGDASRATLRTNW